MHCQDRGCLKILCNYDCLSTRSLAEPGPALWCVLSIRHLNIIARKPYQGNHWLRQNLLAFKYSSMFNCQFTLSTEVCGGSAHLHLATKTIMFCNIPNSHASPAPQTNNTLFEYRERVFSIHPCVVVDIELHLKHKMFTNQWLPWYSLLAIIYDIVCLQ